ncbi:MAG: hypothetical protein R2838_11765 [Caldilineaceae bacterium]
MGLCGALRAGAFSQEETLLLYPPILLAMLLCWGWRRPLRPDVLAVHGVLLGAMAATPSNSGASRATSRPSRRRGPTWAWSSTWPARRTYAPLFIGSGAAAVDGAGTGRRRTALVTWARQRGRVSALARFHQATLFFAYSNWSP